MVTNEPLNPNTFPTYSVRQLFEPSGKHFSHISDLVFFLEFREQLDVGKPILHTPVSAEKRCSSQEVLIQRGWTIERAAPTPLIHPALLCTERQCQ